jgi:uncharacterized protein YegP (UPF0339 family)
MKTNTTILAAIILATATALGGCADDSSADEAGSEEGSDAVSSARAEARIETFRGIDEKFYFHLVAGNGEIVLQSEGYESEAGANNGIASVLDNGLNAGRYEVREAANGDSYFVLKAENNKIIGVSETYVSRSNAERAIDTTKGLARDLAGKRPIPATLTARFETFTGNDGNFYFHLRAKNGETVLASQGYTSKQSATKGIRSVIQNGDEAERFEVLEARDGQWYFRLKAAGNNEVIGRSEMYVSKSNAERGRDTVLGLIRSGEAR